MLMLFVLGTVHRILALILLLLFSLFRFFFVLGPMRFWILLPWLGSFVRIHDLLHFASRAPRYESAFPVPNSRISARIRLAPNRRSDLNGLCEGAIPLPHVNLSGNPFSRRPNCATWRGGLKSPRSPTDDLIIEVEILSSAAGRSRTAAPIELET